MNSKFILRITPSNQIYSLTHTHTHKHTHIYTHNQAYTDTLYRLFHKIVKHLILLKYQLHKFRLYVCPY